MPECLARGRGLGPWNYRRVHCRGGLSGRYLTPPWRGSAPTLGHPTGRELTNLFLDSLCPTSRVRDAAVGMGWHL